MPDTIPVSFIQEIFLTAFLSKKSFQILIVSAEGSVPMRAGLQGRQ